MPFEKNDNKLVTCPYDETHRIKESGLQVHIVNCRLNHLDKEYFTCPFNATHILKCTERDFHLLNCPDKGALDRILAQAVDKNNPFKGRTDVPSFSEPLEVPLEEIWDENLSDGATPGYVPPEPLPGGIIEPRPLAKPSERRKLYQELHTIHPDTEGDQQSSQSARPIPVPRQPKQPSETQKLQIAQQKDLNLQATQNLGLGRGKPATRIAANIFDQRNTTNGSHSNASYSQVINGISNLGLGRGQGVSQNNVLLLDEDDFPTLGCGRGVRLPKSSPRIPGDRPSK